MIEQGPEGGRSPNVSSPCKCHYRGTTITGQEFDSSYKRNKPATFAPNQGASAVTEAALNLYGKYVNAAGVTRFLIDAVLVVQW